MVDAFKSIKPILVIPQKQGNHHNALIVNVLSGCIKLWPYIYVFASSDRPSTRRALQRVPAYERVRGLGVNRTPPPVEQAHSCCGSNTP